MRRRPYGPAAWIVDELDDVTSWAETLRELTAGGAVGGIGEIVPAEGTVVVRCARERAGAVGDALDAVAPSARSPTPHPLVTIDVVYDGEDLDAVAVAVGCSVDEVIERHTTGRYTAAFCGFSPGFAYLTGLDERLRLPRRDRPRTSVPAGSVAIAAGYTAVYPSASPGGWHLLGRTDAVVWDADRDPPALLTPGTPVELRRIGP